MSSDRTTRLLVHRDGHTFTDGIICDGDEVKCDGWRRVRDLALYEAVQIGIYDPTARLVGAPTVCNCNEWGLDLERLGAKGDWAVWEHDKYVPAVYKPSDFQRDFELAGVRDGIRLYRRTAFVKIFQWKGHSTLALYKERGGRSGEQIVCPGDWVLSQDDGSFRALSSRWVETYLEV